MINIVKNQNNTFSLVSINSSEKLDDLDFDEIVRYGNLYVVVLNDLKGVYLNTGKKILELRPYSFEYHQPTNFLIFNSEGSYGIIAQNGKKLRPICDEIEFLDHPIENGSWTFLVKLPSGMTIWNSDCGLLKEIFDSVEHIVPGFILTSIEENWGLYDLSADQLLETIYAFISFNENDKIIVTENETYSIWNYSLDLIAEGFECIYNFVQGSTVALKDGRVGIIDINGSWIPKFSDLDSDNEWWQYSNIYEYPDWLQYKSGGLYGLYNHNEKKLLKPTSVIPFEFINNTSIFRASDYLYGLIDNNLNIVFNPILKTTFFGLKGYYFHRDFISGFPYIAMHPETMKYGLLSSNGNWISEPIYDRICPNDVYDLNVKNLFYLKFEKEDKKGIITVFGKELFCEPLVWFDEIEDNNPEEIFDENLKENEEDNYFRLEANKTYLEHEIPTTNIFFGVLKDGVKGLYNHLGEFKKIE